LCSRLLKNAPRSIDELLREVTDWAAAQNNFYLQTASFRNIYPLAA
jgi:hypothetical protein